ncbi:response regulator transcription factor [Raoultibacter phocaeensis]|uniref:response regulator transcription factor n=1 Tax=Raoultibacter phocaeensis TaxID=2479841 RepID=UPI0015D5F879|nr:helix-turn-helix transcriptional regulator [Raoultibacter phocaeensis]
MGILGRTMNARGGLLIALGFAAFKIVQTYVYSTAVFNVDVSFIVVSGISFSMLSACVVIAADLLVVVLVFSGWLRAFRMPVALPALALATAMIASFLGLLDPLDPLARLAIVSGAYGAANVAITLAWVAAFSRMEPGGSMKSLAFAMLLASGASLFLQDQDRTLVLVVLLMLLACSVWLHHAVVRGSARTDGGDRAHAEQDGRSAKPATVQRPSFRTHLRCLAAIGEGLASLLVLGCTVGIINGFMVAENFSYEGSPGASLIGSIVGTIAFFLLAFTFPKAYNTTKAYRILFPILTALLIAWPFLDFKYSYFFSVAFLAGYNLISISVMYLIISETHKRHLDPYAFMAIAMVFIRLFSAMGIVVGASVSSLNEPSSFKTMLVVAIGLYLLSMVLLLMLRGRNGRASKESGEVAFNRTASMLAQKNHLTERETDILKHIARGRTAAYIGQELYLSPHTVRCHMKSIYAKLGVHSKQELIDLFFK